MNPNTNASSNRGPTGAEARAPTEPVQTPPPRAVCPVCLSTELRPENQCTLRCDHVLCNLCLPQLLSPNCPLCRRPIWREEPRGHDAGSSALQATTPWLLDAGTMLMDTEPMETERRNAATPSSTQDDVSSMDTTAEEGADHIPVLLLTREQLRQIFRR